VTLNDLANFQRQGASYGISTAELLRELLYCGF